MKTKFQTLGCLLVGLALSTASFAGDPTSSILSNDNTANTDNTNSILSTSSYHHGSGGSGDGAFSGNMVHVGVGFISGEGNLYTGYSSSVGPAFEVSYEHALGKFGIGLNFSYQGAKATYNYTELVYNPNTFTYDNVSYTDTYKLSLIQFALRGAYHFSAGDKFDPYVGACLGYCTISESVTSTNPDFTGGTASLTGVEFGGYGGARYFFTDHVGAWVELQYAVASFKVDLGNGLSASTSINPCTVINLGLAFKF